LRGFIRRFGRDGRRLGADIPVASDSISDIQRCGDRFAFSAMDPTFGLLRSDGKAITLEGPRTADMRDKLGDALTLSADAAMVRFGLGGPREASPVLFDLLAGSLGDSPSRPAALKPPSIVGLPTSDWQDNEAPKFRGAPIALEQHETSESLAIRPDQQGFVLGTDYWLRTFDVAGKQRWEQPGPGIAWGVDFSADGEVLAVAYGDGTIRWLRWSDGKELLALFIETPTREWVAWTPTGYYMASVGGEDLIGWHINRGWDQLADFFPASRFSARFNRPDIVKLVLKTRDEAEAIRQANETAKRRQETTPIEAVLPPVVTIVSPQTGASFSGDTVEVAVGLRSPSGLTVDRVDALIDGRPIEARGVAPGQNGPTRKLTIPVPPRDVEISVIARAGELVSDAARVRLSYSGAPPAAVLKPKLYAVAIGVGDYADETLRLTYPAADARGFAEALKRQKGGLYSDVEVRTLVDKDASRANVLDALEWLDAAVTSRDIGMVLIAGHGLTDEKGRYWFLSADAVPKRLGATAVSQEDIRRDMSAIAGKAVLFLDTCHANRVVAARGLGPAGVDVASLVNDFSKTENGLITFAASQGAELSQESPAWGHGAFSLALIEGIGGKADIEHRGTITVSGLDYYIVNRVKDLTEGHQHPVMSRPDTVPDFAFATAR
ncbi:MAG: caspase family protein, partial [Roseiarcus sp.]